MAQPDPALDRVALEARTVLAWDLPTRLFKWSLVFCVFFAWASNEFADDKPYLHKWNGYAALVLITFRILWGLFGGATSRFSSFVTWPWTALRFLGQQLRGRSRPYLGHTPIAAWMILVLMGAVAAQAVLGLYASDPDRLIIEGPLAETVSDAFVQKASSLHRAGFNVILGLACVHIAANLVYAIFVRKGYIRAMVTGRKPSYDYVDMREARPGSLLIAVVCLCAAITLVFGTIVALGGHPLE